MRILIEVEVADPKDIPERIVDAIEGLCTCDPCFFDFISWSIVDSEEV